MSDIRRFILIILLFIVSMMLWNAWQVDYPSNNPEIVSPSTVTSPTTTPVAQPTITSTTEPVAVQPSVNITNISNRYVHIKTDVIDATIDRVGGDLINIKLLKYPVTVDNPNQPVVLLNTDPDSYYIAKSGLVSLSNPTSQQAIIYNSDQTDYQLSPTQQQLDINLTSQNSTGQIITKTYLFFPHSYLVRVNYQINNQSKSPWQGQFFAELQRKQISSKGVGPFNFNTYLGAAVSSPEKRYQQISFKNMSEENFNADIQNGWAAMVQHYFLSAWVPKSTSTYHYYTQPVSDSIYAIGFNSSPIQVNPGATYATNAKLYVGPEIASNLKAVAPGLDLTIDYGMLWFISVAIFAVMKKIYALTGNWGWAIVLVTLLIKILFYKLNSISFRSMAGMRALQPKLQMLKERYGEDRQKLTQATMELYKKEKINPLSGCLPLLVQIPVFLALYWVLVESVELRQAPFILWIHDLSVKDPYYVLPILMGLTIFIQQWLNPKAPDPVQQKVMMMMPFIFTAMFLSFPAGLVLYWVVNNTLSILQQWYIMNHVVPKDAGKKTK